MWGRRQSSLPLTGGASSLGLIASGQIHGLGGAAKFFARTAEPFLPVS
jgi:hypothetical protein